MSEYGEKFKISDIVVDAQVQIYLLMKLHLTSLKLYRLKNKLEFTETIKAFIETTENQLKEFKELINPTRDAG